MSTKNIPISVTANVSRVAAQEVGRIIYMPHRDSSRFLVKPAWVSVGSSTSQLNGDIE
ncbi:hypothetical protein AN958_03092 [Leucoagaricus sp. SymC.cos]|nr:hypothetical protein AN958_03092 [Leucoagaricus sp. SymC.cos]